MCSRGRLAVLTGGGDCPGLNAVIRAIVKTAVYNNFEVYGIANGFKGLVEGVAEPLTLAAVSGILPRGGTILGTTNRDNPFRFVVGKDAAGKPIFRDCSDRVKANLEKYKIDVLIVIGGDGSLNIANKLHLQQQVNVIGVPKTIDNDLPCTERTFGFDTAVTTATDAVDRLHTTAESHHRVMALEVMGRYAGWIALHSGLAGGADCILIPEIPYKIDAVIQKIRQRQALHKQFSIVVVAEGARTVGGSYSVARTVQESFDSLRLGGAGEKVVQEIEAQTGIESRCTVLGYLQRGGSPTAYDRVLASRYGVAAVQAAIDGRLNSMVALQSNIIVSVPIAKAAAELHTVPLDSDIVLAARNLSISFGD